MANFCVFRKSIQQIICLANLGNSACFHRIGKARSQSIRPDIALWIDRNEANLGVAPVFAAQHKFVAYGFYGLLTGLLRTCPMAHFFHHPEGAHHADDFFALTGCSDRAHLIVNV